MEKVTRRLAAFAAGLKFADLDPLLAADLKKHLLDGLGCGLFGLTLPWCRIVNDFVKEQGGREEATLWREGFKGPGPNIALGLGVMIHSFDFDDYHNAKVHPAAVVVPAVLAAGEPLAADGEAILTAMAAGYEVMIRVSLATGPASSRLKGWHLTGTTGTFGAAAAAGNLLQINADDMASALGMAGTQSAGLWAFTADGAMSKRFHGGRASQSGVMGALLAKRGFKGPTEILEAADGGFCRATSDHPDLSLAVEKLGEKFFSGDVTIKPYACCGSIHSALDCLFQLVTAHRINPPDIEKIIVRTAKGVDLQCGFPYEPLSVLQAQMSLQYCLAVAALEGRALIEQFTPEKIADPRILEMAKKVEIAIDPEIEALYPEKFANKVEIVLAGGQGFTARVDSPSGSPENPLTFDEVAKKFMSLAGQVIPKDRAEELVERVGKIEKVKHIGELTALLR